MILKHVIAKKHIFGRPFTVELPLGAEIVHFGEDTREPETLAIWFEEGGVHRVTDLTYPRKFAVIPTGKNLLETQGIKYWHLKSCIAGGYAFHLVEVA